MRGLNGARSGSITQHIVARKSLMFRSLWIASRQLAMLGLWAWVGTASAGTLGAHVASMHFPQRDFNNFNPGVYYRSDEGWTAGAYLNSLRHGSVYGGYTWQHGRFGVTGGAITGYGHGLQPLLVPSVVLFTYQGVAARLAYIPRVEKRIGSHVLHLMLEY
jgi:hypothetical protein